MHETGMDVFDCSVMVEHEPRMANLRRVLEQLALWLISRKLAPFSFYAAVDDDDDGFDFGFAVDDAYLDDFAEVEMEFWEYVSQLVPLTVEDLTFIYSPSRQPGSTINKCSDYFELSISPDLSSVAYRFPPQEFWTKRSELEQVEYAVELARSHSKRRNRPVRLIASDGQRLESPS
jgi:hypothetical protein